LFSTCRSCAPPRQQVRIGPEDIPLCNEKHKGRQHFLRPAPGTARLVCDVWCDVKGVLSNTTRRIRHRMQPSVQHFKTEGLCNACRRNFTCKVHPACTCNHVFSRYRRNPHREPVGGPRRHFAPCDQQAATYTRAVSLLVLSHEYRLRANLAPTGERKRCAVSAPPGALRWARTPCQ